jgi:hypothetical protein
MCDVLMVMILHMTRQYRLVWKWVTPQMDSHHFPPWNGNFGVSLFSDTPVHGRSSLYNLIGCRSVFQRFAHRKSCKLQPPLRIVLSNLPSASRKGTTWCAAGSQSRNTQKSYSLPSNCDNGDSLLHLFLGISGMGNLTVPLPLWPCAEVVLPCCWWWQGWGSFWV